MRKMYIRGGALTDGMRAYLTGQHELCQDLDKIFDSKERAKMKNRKRVMEHRIRKRLEQVEYDLRLAKAWALLKQVEEISKPFEQAPEEKIKRFMKRRGRGLHIKAKFRCFYCDKENEYDAIYDKGELIGIFKTEGIKRKET